MIKSKHYKLFFGDCFSILSKVKNNSITLILVDPPYGTTPLKWDKIIDFNFLWKEYSRILKPNGCICIFGQEPFSTLVRSSNLKEYRYDWYWIKERLTNVFQVKRRPGKVVENIIVFSPNQSIYNPQKTLHIGPKVTNKIGENARFSDTQGSSTKPLEYHDDGTRYPNQVLYFNRENSHTLVHPTQKPVKLLEYLINTYTNKNNIVLDNCMGSGSTGVACMNTNRRFIGIERDKKYFKIAVDRIQKADNTLTNIGWKNENN